MRYRSLGRSGVRVSEVCLGSWLTYGETVNEADAGACIRRAFELGVNYFDTADSYGDGEAERVLGRVLKTLPREKYIVGTKCFFPRADAPDSRGLSREHIIASVERSLRNLQLDVIDLMQCHRYDPKTPLEETLRAMDDLVRAGKILYWGVSRWTAAQLTEAWYLAKLNGLTPPTSHQPPYSMFNRAIENEILDVCGRLGIGTIVYSPLAQGVLTGKYARNQTPPGSRAANPETAGSMHHFKAEWLAKADALSSIASDLKMPLSRLSLAWCLRDPRVNGTIVGASKQAQIEENVAASGIVLPEEVLTRIERVLNNKPTDPYTGLPLP